FAFIAKAVSLRHLAVLKIDLVREIRADHRDRLVTEALEPLLHDERGDAVPPLARSGTREHQAPIRLPDAGDPDLRAVEDVSVALLLGAGLDRAPRVRSAARLGDGNERLVAVLNRRHRVFFDLVLAAEKDRVRRVV